MRQSSSDRHFRIFIRVFCMWFVFVILAIINGVFRNSVITPNMGEYAGHVISTIILSSSILIGTFLFLKNIKIEYTGTNLLSIGGFWLILTMTF